VDLSQIPVARKGKPKGKPAKGKPGQIYLIVRKTGKPGQIYLIVRAAISKIDLSQYLP
jgi:hypothetical protein